MKYALKQTTLALFAVLIAGACSLRAEDVRSRTTFKSADGTVNVRPISVTITNGALTDNGDGTATVAIGSGSISGVTAGTGLSSNGSNPPTLSTVVSTYAVTAAGTAYSMTATTAAVTFGTTSPSFTIGAAGTYLIFARANLKYNGATYAASQTARLVLRRTNNTAAYIAASETNPSMRVVTTVTDDVGVIETPLQIYTTTTASDVIALWGFVSATPSAGSVDINEANIIAVRLF